MWASVASGHCVLLVLQAGQPSIGLAQAKCCVDIDHLPRRTNVVQVVRRGATRAEARSLAVFSYIAPPPTCLIRGSVASRVSCQRYARNSVKATAGPCVGTRAVPPCNAVCAYGPVSALGVRFERDRAYCEARKAPARFQDQSRLSWSSVRPCKDYGSSSSAGLTSGP